MGVGFRKRQLRLRSFGLIDNEPFNWLASAKIDAIVALRS
jgi:hypothetical protein